MDYLADNDTLMEKYLQISPNILESFPRFRPPVSLYVWNEELQRIELFRKAGDRLGKRAQEAVASLCADGKLFFFRGDYKQYAEQLSKNLGLVLTEDNLNEWEVAEIFFKALHQDVEQFFDQPRKPFLDQIATDITILAEYLWTDPNRVAFLVCTLDRTYSLANHAVNTMFIGLGIYVLHNRESLAQLELTSLALGLLLHDLGMSKVPGFITGKEGILLRKDKESVHRHPDIGASIIKRLKLDNSVVVKCMEQHHERLDGSGYPMGLKGESISLYARITAIADTFCALVSERPHREPAEAKKAVKQLLHPKNRYDAKLAALLVELLEGVGSQCPLILPQVI